MLKVAALLTLAATGAILLRRAYHRDLIEQYRYADHIASGRFLREYYIQEAINS